MGTARDWLERRGVDRGDQWSNAKGADSRVFANKGDPVPCRCKCSHVYVPAMGTATSQCPRCRQWNDHNEQSWAVAEEGL